MSWGRDENYRPPSPGSCDLIWFGLRVDLHPHLSRPPGRSRRERLPAWIAALAAFCSVMNGQQLPVKVFSTSDGFPDNSVRRIVRDPSGYLWFCTSQGLTRFDGYEFTTYGTEQGLPDLEVNDLIITRNGEYWVATRKGVSRFLLRSTGTLFKLLLSSNGGGPGSSSQPGMTAWNKLDHCPAQSCPGSRKKKDKLLGCASARKPQVMALDWKPVKSRRCWSSNVPRLIWLLSQNRANADTCRVLKWFSKSARNGRNGSCESRRLASKRSIVSAMLKFLIQLQLVKLPFSVAQPVKQWTGRTINCETDPGGE